MLASLIFDFVGTGLVMPFGVVYLHEVRGIELGVTGTLLALPAIVGLAVVGPGGVLIDKFGARKVVIAAVLAEMLAQFLMAQVRDVPLAALSLTLSGLAIGVIFPAVQAMVATVMPPHQRQHYFGLNFTLLNLGLGLGGILGGVLVDVSRPETFELLYYIDTATFLCPLVLYLWPLRHYGQAVTASDREVESGNTGGYRQVLADRVMRRLVLLGFLTAFIGYAQFGVGFQAFARQMADISTQALGFAYGANTAIIVVAQLVVLKFVAGKRRTRALVIMCALWSISWTVMALAAPVSGTTLAVVLVCASAAIFGVGETFLQPTLPAMVNDLAPDDLRGRYNSASAAAFHLAEIVGPPFAGLMIGHALGAIYPLTLVAGCVVAAVVTLRMERWLAPRVNGVGQTEDALEQRLDESADSEMTLEVQRAKAE